MTSDWFLALSLLSVDVAKFRSDHIERPIDEFSFEWDTALSISYCGICGRLAHVPTGNFVDVRIKLPT